MARDDLFRRSFEAGTAFLDMTREKAEALVKELVKAGDVTKGKASKIIDEVLERSRRATDDLVQIVRREIGEQVAAMGLATKDDLDNLEQRLSGGASAGAASDVPPVTEAVPATAAPAPEAPGAAAAGEAKLTGARTVGKAKAAKATKAAKAARKKAAPPAPDVPAGD
jgi:polyhydroxyalkanoate synthesis regulator phasin